jgi:hypothetical protein
MAQPPPANRPSPSWTFGVGVALLAVILFLLVVQRVSTGGFSTGRNDSILLLVGVALFTGIAFWLVTPGAEGTVDLKQLGIHLGGGAGIGAAFMLLAWWLTSSSPTYIVVSLDSASLQHELALASGPADSADIKSAYLLPPKDRVFVEFGDGKEKGWFTTHHLEGAKVVTLKYKVTRYGLEHVNPNPERSEAEVKP